MLGGVCWERIQTHRLRERAGEKKDIRIDRKSWRKRRHKDREKELERKKTHTFRGKEVERKTVSQKVKIERPKERTEDGYLVQKSIIARE